MIIEAVVVAGFVWSIRAVSAVFDVFLPPPTTDEEEELTEAERADRRRQSHERRVLGSRW
jgi:hypothetical protein